MMQTKKTKKKKKKKSLFSKLQLIPILHFQVKNGYVYFHTFHGIDSRPLCWINSSHVQDFMWKIALILYWNDFSLIPLGKCAS